MTTWRENADRIRIQMKAAVTHGLKEELGRMNHDQWYQAADTLPEPENGGGYEITATSPDADYSVKLYRYPGGHGVGFADLRGLDPEFVRVCNEYAHREDPAILVDYLKSEKPLGTKERHWLARLWPKRKKEGRPRNVQIRGAAKLAWRFYRQLQEMNKASGVNDRGCSDDMKMYAARAMVRDYFSFFKDHSEEGQERFALQVREYMDKSKARRSGTEEAVITIPAAWLDDDRQKS